MPLHASSNICRISDKSSTQTNLVAPSVTTVPHSTSSRLLISHAPSWMLKMGRCDIGDTMRSLVANTSIWSMQPALGGSLHCVTWITTAYGSVTATIPNGKMQCLTLSQVATMMKSERGSSSHASVSWLILILRWHIPLSMVRELRSSL